MEYINKLFFDNFIPAIVSAFGVFCLTFLLMYIHYKIRKKTYKGMVTFIEKNPDKKTPFSPLQILYFKKYSFKIYLLSILNNKFKDFFMNPNEK